jgi:hypothetical protein
MATILDLAQHADVTPETVLRVILREPTSEIAKRRVAEAVAELGPPDYPRPDGSVEVLPPDREHESNLPEPAAPSDPSAPALDEAVLARVQSAVDPASEQVLQLSSLFQELVRRLSSERRERIEDLELMTELIIEGWRGVDRRLGRIEKALGRLEDVQAAASGGKTRTVVRLEDWVKQPFGEPEPDRSASET